jgi:general secretion pathway protein K
MILVNTLTLVALASAIVVLMMGDQERGFDRSLRFREASQAIVIARAGEMSAKAALRRDAAEAPETDHLKEPWSSVVQQRAGIAGGTFELSISDAESRFNLNNLAQAGAASAGGFAPLAGALQLDAATLARIAVMTQETGPLLRLSQLRDIGVDDATIARLAPLVTVLPGSTSVNVNTAGEPLLTALVGSQAAARMLISQRDRAGFLTPEDFSGLGLSLPSGTGFTSNHSWVRTTVTIGGTTQTLTSLVMRVTREGRPEVVTLGRWRGAAAPDQVPPI